MNLYKVIHFTNLTGNLDGRHTEESTLVVSNTVRGAKMKASQWRSVEGTWSQCIDTKTFEAANEYVKTRGHHVDDKLYVKLIESPTQFPCPLCDTETSHDVMINSDGTAIAGYHCRECVDNETSHLLHDC